MLANFVKCSPHTPLCASKLCENARHIPYCVFMLTNLVKCSPHTPLCASKLCENAHHKPAVQ